MKTVFKKSLAATGFVCFATLIGQPAYACFSVFCPVQDAGGEVVHGAQKARDTVVHTTVDTFHTVGTVPSTIFNGVKDTGAALVRIAPALALDSVKLPLQKMAGNLQLVLSGNLDPMAYVQQGLELDMREGVKMGKLAGVLRTPAQCDQFAHLGSSSAGAVIAYYKGPVAGQEAIRLGRHAGEAACKEEMGAADSQQPGDASDLQLSSMPMPAQMPMPMPVSMPAQMPMPMPMPVSMPAQMPMLMPPMGNFCRAANGALIGPGVPMPIGSFCTTAFGPGMIVPGPMPGGSF